MRFFFLCEQVFLFAPFFGKYDIIATGEVCLIRLIDCPRRDLFGVFRNQTFIAY